MKRVVVAFAGLGVALLFNAGVVNAETEAVRTMAKIAMKLNHFPTDEDKAVLKTIIDSDDSSEEEAAIAMAISNMEHQVKSADAQRLADIVDDDLSGDAARKLAGIVLGINHMASDEARAELEALAGA